VDEDGRILEGLTSNFFALKGGVLWTNEGSVLSGITRSLVIDVAAESGLKINLESVTTSEILQIEEAFITSSSRAILPVVQIDDFVIGDGKPGQVTCKLMHLLERRIRTEIQPI
jgi:branched-subunit amino acid aminotransferase/4-amino-4-deoxychorismate lyase